MARKNERTVLVKTMDKYDARKDETHLYIRVGANKKTTMFRVTEQANGLFQFYGGDTRVSLDFIEKVVNYEYDVAGEDYVVNGIHRRISTFYSTPLFLTVNSAAFTQIKNYCREILAEREQSYQPELFETAEYASTIMTTPTFVNLICLMSLYLDLSPRNVVPKHYHTTCTAILYFTAFLYEAGKAHSRLTLYDWIAQKKVIMQAFEAFLFERIKGQEQGLIQFSSQALAYITNDFPELTEADIPTYSAEIASIFEGSLSWNATQLVDS
jgi:hypothetical protein